MRVLATSRDGRGRWDARDSLRVRSRPTNRAPAQGTPTSAAAEKPFFSGFDFKVQGSRVGEGTWHGLGANACPGPKKKGGLVATCPHMHGDVAGQPPAKQPATTSPRPPQENPAGQYGGASVVSATQGAHSCSEPEPNQRPRATIPTRLVDRRWTWGRWLVTGTKFLAGNTMV